MTRANPRHPFAWETFFHLHLKCCPTAKSWEEFAKTCGALLLKYNLEFFCFFLLKGRKWPLKALWRSPSSLSSCKKGDFTYCACSMDGPLGSTGRWERLSEWQLAVPHSCCWSRTGDKGAEPGPLKHLPRVVLLSAIQSGAEQGRVLHPLRRDKLPWLNA